MLQTENNTLIVDSYNANPTSMKAALDNFNQVKLDNKMILLGDMFELGEVSIREHGVIIALLKELKFEHVILVGNNFYFYSDNTEFVFKKDIEELMVYLVEKKISGRNILIKGSRGLHLEDTIKYL